MDKLPYLKVKKKRKREKQGKPVRGKYLKS